MSVAAEQLPEFALEVEEVSVSYGGVKAVDGVSFGIPRGSIIGLIGPNGAGKTTIFDAICGFAPIERGRISLGGRDITGLSPSAKARAGLGRSFQDARLFQSLTVSEALSCAFERHIRGRDPVSTMLGLPWVRSSERKVAKRVEEIIELMGLSAFRDKFISELSTGSRRVVDLACTLAHEPTVLLLDEPSSGMAQKETEAMAPLLIRVKESTGCTMLLIEHDMPLITSVSDELIALETGRVIARGTPKEVTNDSRVVEAYLGTDETIIARSGEARTQKGSPGKKKQPAKGSGGPTSTKDGKGTKSRTRTTRRSSEESQPEARNGRRTTSERPKRRKKAASSGEGKSSASGGRASSKKSTPPSRKKKASSSSGGTTRSSSGTKKKRPPSSGKKKASSSKGTKKTSSSEGKKKAPSSGRKKTSSSEGRKKASSSGKRSAPSKRSSTEKKRSPSEKKGSSSSGSKRRKSSSTGGSKKPKAKPKRPRKPSSGSDE